MWKDKLKESGVNIHIIATGGGAGLQKLLWEVPGSSAYLSGASFPYSASEQEDLLGFMPEHFCSEDAAIYLASAAYMKAYKFKNKKPVGIGITATVTSEKMHCGEHRVHACIITDNNIYSCEYFMQKGSSENDRIMEGKICDDIGLMLLSTALNLDIPSSTNNSYSFSEAESKAVIRFFQRPFFASNGKRFKEIPNFKDFALMPGSFNPPHEGHFGMADDYEKRQRKSVVFEIATNPPHKDKPIIQDLLKRAKMLKGRNVLFSVDTSLFINKSKSYIGMPILIGADTMLRMFDTKWGFSIEDLFKTFKENKTKFFVYGRMVDDEFVSGWDAIIKVLNKFKGLNFYFIHNNHLDHSCMFIDMVGRWDINSTELRK
jgi:nicotinamide mononucleotide (NMN) deamidase PncC